MELPEEEASSKTARNRAILETLYSTGARVSELVGMNWGDVNLDEGMVRLRGKGKKERLVPIGQIAIEAIKDYIALGSAKLSLDKATGETHEITDGTLYALDKHDQHTLYGGTEDMRLICAFNPPVTGREVHDEDGAYLPDTGED